MSKALRGEVWLVTLDPTQGREQAGTRPALIVSDDIFNQGHSELVFVAPITSKGKGIRSHVSLLPPEGGLNLPSFIKCEDVRSISVHRLVRRFGRVSDSTLVAVEDRLRIILGL